MLLISIILIIMGILQTIFPKQFFMFGKMWQFKEGAEPSEISIVLTRIGGVVIVIIALSLII